MEIKECNDPLANSIKKLISQRGLKQNAVAEMAGLSPQELSDMLNNRRIIKACNVPGLARAIGVSPNILYAVEE